MESEDFHLTGGEKKLCVIGLGYVGLPLALEFAKHFDVIGFDTNDERVSQLNASYDVTNESAASDFEAAKFMTFTSDRSKIAKSNIYIVTVPTPIDDYKQPDFKPLYSASELIATALKEGDVVIYESTVYPGATEEKCVPVLEQNSGLKFNHDFFVGYSPERINPGDNERRLPNITKVVSGSTPAVAKFIDELYSKIINAGTYVAESIMVAEAAKVIENTQRDVNIALINELSIIFNKLNIDTLAVLNAAGTKWNFLPFRPGLVGGHCIGVDPYYLTHKAQSIGYNPEMILAGRRLNDNMGKYIAGEIVKKMIRKGGVVSGASACILGFTFKENCPDVRNTKVIDIILELQEYGIKCEIYDPVCGEQSAAECELNFITDPEAGSYGAVILAVAHGSFVERGPAWLESLGSDNCVIADLKSVFDSSVSDFRL